LVIARGWGQFIVVKFDEHDDFDSRLVPALAVNVE